MIPRPDICLHLTVEMVEDVHAEALTRYGGLDRVRDRTLLESSVAAPQASFSGTSVYADLVEIAAAYLFFICRNHPFLDGNKRTALGACLVFLRLNGLAPKPDGPEWEALTMAVAAGAFDRERTAHDLRGLVD